MRHGIHVGLPGQPRVQRFKQSCCLQQQRLSAAAAESCERDLAMQQRCLCALRKTIQHP